MAQPIPSKSSLFKDRPNLLTEAEAAKELRVSVKTLSRMRGRREIGFVRSPSGLIRIPQESVNEWRTLHFVPPKVKTSTRRARKATRKNSLPTAPKDSLLAFIDSPAASDGYQAPNSSEPRAA